VHALGGVLQRAHLSHGQHGFDARQRLLRPPRRFQQDAPLVLGRWVVDADTQQEAVHLRLGQRVRAVTFLRVLRRHHQERRVEWVGPAVDRHLSLVHRFQQRALRSRRRSVDLIRKDEVREQRSGTELEFAGFRVEDRDANHVRG